MSCIAELAGVPDHLTVRLILGLDWEEICIV